MANIEIRLVFVAIIATAGVCLGHEIYQNMIPNGNRVPNPCTADTLDTWGSVGHALENIHNRTKGKTTKNNFGLDFLSLKKKESDPSKIWPLLCPMDSDGDLRSNGEELGDTKCEWREGHENPGDGSGLSHPGIKEEEDGSLSTATRNKYCFIKI